MSEQEHPRPQPFQALCTGCSWSYRERGINPDPECKDCQAEASDDGRRDQCASERVGARRERARIVAMLRERAHGIDEAQPVEELLRMADRIEGGDDG